MIFIEVFGMAALTYTNLEDHEKTLAYSGELLDHFFAQDGPYEDMELINALIIIRYRAFGAIGDRRNAYKFSKTAISRYKSVNEEVELAYKKEKEWRVDRILSLATRGLFWFTLLLVALQYLFRILPYPWSLYVAISLLALFISLRDNGLFSKILNKII